MLLQSRIVKFQLLIRNKDAEKEEFQFAALLLLLDHHAVFRIAVHSALQNEALHKQNGIVRLVAFLGRKPIAGQSAADLCELQEFAPLQKRVSRRSIGDGTV